MRHCKNVLVTGVTGFLGHYLLHELMKRGSRCVLLLRGQGHNVIGAGCMPKLFAGFLDTADAKALDAKCLDKLAYTPPFTGFNGWGP